MLTIDELAKARSLGLKLGQLYDLIAGLDKEASVDAKARLNRRLEQLHEELTLIVSAPLQDNRALMELITSPPKAIWQSLDRKCYTLADLDHWIVEMDSGDTQEKRNIAEFKLLFYFATNETLDLFLELHGKYKKSVSARPPC
jgi:hypothetical protein